MAEDTQEIRLLKGRLNGAQKNRLRKLFDMRYTPGELASEIGINVRQFYKVYIPAGCPHERNERGYLWINGKEFREWIAKTYQKKIIGKNQAYCRTCDKAVDIVKPQKKVIKDTTYYLCDCPNCGRVISRIIENRRGQNDRSGKLEAT